MDTKTKGIALLISAVVLGVIVYSMRPPSGFGEALMMASQNPGGMYLKPSVYYTGLIISGILAIFGVVKLTKSSD